jgi:hypothetical protein
MYFFSRLRLGLDVKGRTWPRQEQSLWPGWKHFTSGLVLMDDFRTEVYINSNLQGSNSTKHPPCTGERDDEHPPHLRLRPRRRCSPPSAKAYSAAHPPRSLRLQHLHATRACVWTHRQWQCRAVHRQVRHCPAFPTLRIVHLLDQRVSICPFHRVSSLIARQNRASPGLSPKSRWR